MKDDRIGDTGLLRDTGMVHSCALSEFDLDRLDISESPTVLQIVDLNLEDDILAQYCFVTDKEILAGSVLNREIKRLVIFFHHFDREERYELLPILDKYFQGDRIDVELPVALQQWLEQIEKLDLHERQMLAVWLTRYCFAPSATLKEFEAARDVVYVKSDRHTDSAKPNKSEPKSRLFFLKLILHSIWRRCYSSF